MKSAPHSPSSSGGSSSRRFVRSGGAVRRDRVVGRTARTLALFFLVASGTTSAAGLDPGDIALYGSLLQEHTEATSDVVQTRVRYRTLKQDPRWRRLIDAVAQSDPQELGSVKERLAYWINVYNIFAIDLVLGGYPIESIKDLGSFFSPVWGITAGRIHGQKYSLEEIEHEILRPMGDPRIHAAIVCASVSCPPLSRTPFEAHLIDAQLDATLRAWLTNPEKGMRLDRESETLTVSKIFDWFESDFEAAGGVVRFILPHVAPEDADWLRGRIDDVDIEYFDYDWGLND